jgi:hypothetical protein
MRPDPDFVRRGSCLNLKRLAVFIAILATCEIKADLLEEIDKRLSITALDGHLHLKLSGTIDLEAYGIDRPAPALIYTSEHFLLNPRLSLFLDAQLDTYLYSFVQARLDRGFDPSDAGAEVRLDEYLLRLTPWKNVKLSIQAGKFGTVAGNWVRRHYSWDNPFIDAPLPYENLTGLWDSAAPESLETLFYWGHVPYDDVTRFGDGYSDKRLRLPIIWGPSYASGFSVLGALGQVDYAFEIKNAALASRPESWDFTQVNLDDPTFSGRIGFSPSVMWNLGVSGSVGPYLQAEAASTLPHGASIGDYREILLGQDVSFAWHHLQLWAEIFETRFEVPNVGDADVLSYYVEAKYKVTPQLFLAARWNQQLYATVPYNRGSAQWGNDAWRIDAAVGYRFSTWLQIKFQAGFTHHDDDVQEGERLLATQLTLKF